MKGQECAFLTGGEGHGKRGKKEKNMAHPNSTIWRRREGEFSLGGDFYFDKQ